ncbi:cAMP-dependent protein kinase inhibitor gamma, partial [Austrofundulus limnaeus]|uniref:cAMP-dependent protein kinase inhibitor gamma n=1 Tax=Austrofundulus limnaeus TaxID=52670 RepID=A0A2I4CRF9_AUSLI
MMDVETSYSDFINCDRTGRRNAVPDITGEGSVEASTSELTKDLAEMDLKAAEGAPGTSPAPEAEGSTSQDTQASTSELTKDLAEMDLKAAEGAP